MAEMDAVLKGAVDVDAVDVDAMDKALQGQIGPMEDVARSALTGVVKAIPDVLDVGGAAVATVADKAMGGKDGWLNTFGQYAERRPVSKAVDKMLDTTEHQPQTDAGRYTSAAVRGAVLGPALGGPALAMASGGAAGGIGAEALGDFGQRLYGETGRMVGNVLGGIGFGAAGVQAPRVIGPLTARAKSAFQKAISPKLDPKTAVLANRAAELKVPLSLNQVADSRALNTVQKVSQEIPFSGVRGFEEGQVAAWNKGVAKTLGLDAGDLSPETVKVFLGNIDDGYNSVFGGTTVRMTKEQTGLLDNLAQDVGLELNESAAKTVKQNIDWVKSQLKGGFVKGEKANSIRKEIMARASRASPELKDALGRVAATVNDIMVDGMPADRADSLRVLNRQYRNFKTVEPLLEKAVDGTINPNDLLQRVASSKYINAARTATGEDELVDLARIGKMMPRLGGSDTAQKQALISGATGAGALVEPTTTGTVLAGNRAYQKLFNQSQSLLSKSIEKSLPKNVSINQFKQISEAIPSGDVGMIVAAAGGAGVLKSFLEYVEKSGGKDARKDAFELRKQLKLQEKVR